MGGTVTADGVGRRLRDWRTARRLSQLELAGKSGVSARHLSFVETGRSRPTREMILRLATELAVPLRSRNELLLAGGFAPAYGESDLSTVRGGGPSTSGGLRGRVPNGNAAGGQGPDVKAPSKTASGGPIKTASGRPGTTGSGRPGTTASGRPGRTAGGAAGRTPGQMGRGAPGRRADRAASREPDDGAADAGALPLATVLAALRNVLVGHQPYPAVLIDRHWTMIDANDAVARLTEGCASWLLEPPVNVLRLSLHPEGMAPRIDNLAEWRKHVLHRLDEQAGVTGDPVLRELRAELAGYPGGESADRPDGLVVPLRLGGLAFFSVTSVLGTPLDVTLSELAIESFLPADAATATALQNG